MKLYTSLLFVFIVGTFKVSAQTEYLVKADLATGTLTKLKKIDSVRWILGCGAAYDQSRDKYYFAAHNDSMMNGGHLHFFTVSTKNGALLSNPTYYYSSTPTSIVYSSYNDTLYGVRWDTAVKHWYFVCIDPVTGVYTDLTVIPKLKYIQVEERALDRVHKKYYISGDDSLTNSFLFSIDLATYTPLSPVSITSSLSWVPFGFSYDANLDTMVCLFRNNPSTTYAAYVNTHTGVITPIDTIAGYKSTTTGSYGYDEVHHYHMIKGTDTGNKWRLYTIDATNGNVIHNPLHPTPLGGQNPIHDNFIYPVYDKDSDAVYGLYWEAVTDTTNDVGNIKYTGQQSCLTIPSVFTPNNDGDNDRFEIKTQCPVTGFKMHIFNLSGQHIYESNNINNGWDGSMNNAPAPVGTYFYTIEFQSTAGKKEYRRGKVTLVR